MRDGSRRESAVAQLFSLGGSIHTMQTQEHYEISTDRSRLDIAVIHDFLRSSYWAKGIPRPVVEKSIEHSLCFGAYADKRQVGFARVITDFVCVAYIADLFVVPEYRKRGISKLLMHAIIEHSELQGVRGLLLATRDTHGLYAQFGFHALPHPEHFMTLRKPVIYNDAA